MRHRLSLAGLMFLLPLLLAVVPAAKAQREVSIGVLGLFHPRELVLEQESGQVISVTAETASSGLVLNGEPGRRQLILRVAGNRVVVGSRAAENWTATARDGSPTAFQLTVPGKFRRSYWGRLAVHAENGELVAVVSMDRETAVASIVGAEMIESTPLEALKAQAVATRSFLAAGTRHLNFDFCDTTHCQFLKSPPPVTGRVWSAVQSTRGLVLQYRGKAPAALYSSRCGGRTRSLRDVGMEPGDAYPYYSVRCAFCQRHPLVWKSRIGSRQSPQSGDEGKRIEQAQQWGWSVIPGSDFTAAADGSGWQLEGHSVGHGVGMCQFGAAGMAAKGAAFREILALYYPNTVLISQP
ncbi:MAG: SpoIID/LytB domain-containing protein [Terracidiphilus sp.]|nr:SpoIID/LytB domain-containing protein [Terracidiphilus sp.]